MAISLGRLTLFSDIPINHGKSPFSYGFIVESHTHINKSNDFHGISIWLFHGAPQARLPAPEGGQLPGPRRGGLPQGVPPGGAGRARASAN